MRLFPILLVLILVCAAVPASADRPLYGVTLRAPPMGEAGKPILVEGQVDAWGYPAAPATLDFYINGKRVASYVLYVPWFEVSLTLPANRGEHSIHAVVWSGVSNLRSQSSPVVVVAAVKPTAPLDVAAAPVPDAHAMRVSWSPPSDDGGARVQSYRVYRATVNSTPFTLRATVPANTTFLQEATMPETAYLYRVAAVNAIGESGPSVSREAMSGPRLSADAFDSFQLRFRVCWYYSQWQQTCELASSNSSVQYTTSMVRVEPILSGKVHRAGNPLPYAAVNGSYYWNFDDCPPGYVCPHYLEHSPTLTTFAGEDGSFSLGGSSWSHLLSSGGAGCNRFSAYATLTSGNARAEPYGWVDLCH